MHDRISAGSPRFREAVIQLLRIDAEDHRCLSWSFSDEPNS